MRRPSVRLSELGELGLLAELERRGLARGIQNDAAQLDGNLVVTQDALVQDVHFRFDLLVLEGPRLSRSRCQPQRSGRVRSRSRKGSSSRWRSPTRPSSGTCSRSTKD